MINNNARYNSVQFFDWLMGALLVLMLMAGVLGGIYVYRTVREFVAHSQLPIFPEVHSDPDTFPQVNQDAEPLPTPDNRPDNRPDNTPPGTPEPEIREVVVEGDEENYDRDVLPPVEPTSVLLVSPEPNEEVDVPLPPAATERLTILVMGIDRRKGEEGPWRTDSMIVISLDPSTDSVAMLSMPRDLYVTIPNYGYGEFSDRINTAFFYGDAAGYPGGGAALARHTIRRNFGLYIDRYLVLDFDGFERIIDEVDGIQVDVPELLVDTQYPTEDYGYMTVRFNPGLQWMNGEQALIYSRTRKSTSDFARAARQQQVIMALRDRVLSLDLISSLTPGRLSRLVLAMNDSIQTDITLDEVLSFAQVAARIETDNINRLVIDPNMVYNGVTDKGAQVLIPQWRTILPQVSETFDIGLLSIAPHPTVPPTPVPTWTFVPTRAPERQVVGTRAPSGTSSDLTPTWYVTWTPMAPAVGTPALTPGVATATIDPLIYPTIYPTLYGTAYPTAYPTVTPYATVHATPYPTVTPHPTVYATPYPTLPVNPTVTTPSNP